MLNSNEDFNNWIVTNGKDDNFVIIILKEKTN